MRATGCRRRSCGAKRPPSRTPWATAWWTTSRSTPRACTPRRSSRCAGQTTRHTACPLPRRACSTAKFLRNTTTTKAAPSWASGCPTKHGRAAMSTTPLPACWQTTVLPACNGQSIFSRKKSLSLRNTGASADAPVFHFYAKKPPPTEGKKCQRGLGEMSNQGFSAQSSAASSRLPSFLACSTTAGTSISGRVS